MAKGLITHAYLEDTADAIRVLRGESNTYTPDEFGEKIIDAIPDVTVTDDIVSVTDAAAYPAEGLEFAMEPVQDLHGYDKPWPAGGGKNLLVPSVNGGSITWNDVTISVQNGELRLDGRPTMTGGRNMLITANFSLPAGSYIITCPTTQFVLHNSRGGIIANTLGTQTFTLAEETTVYAGFNVIENTTYSGTLKAQIELGSTATSYEPYSNICPISGWTGVNGERTGKNLLDCTSVSTTINNVTFTHNNDGSVTVNGTATATAIYQLKAVPSDTYLPLPDLGLKYNTNYILSGCPDGGSMDGGYKLIFRSGGSAWNKIDSGNGLAFNISDTGSTLKWMPCIVVGNGVTANNVVFKPMICLSTATDPDYAHYEPYQGTSIPITFPALGKNLFDKSTMINGLYSDENFTVIQDTSTVYRSYKYYLKAGTYTFSASKEVRILRSVIDGVYSSSQSDLPYTFSVASDGYVGFSFRNKDDTDWNTNTNCQIELGNQATSYEPYSNTVYGGKVDVVNGKLTVDYASVDLGTFNWTYINNGGTNVGFYTIISDMKQGLSYAPLLCDSYATGGIQWNNIVDKQIGVNATGTPLLGTQQVIIKDSAYTDATTFKTAMQGVQLVYELATPIEYDITPQEVQTLLGDNNIWCDTGDTTLEYKVDLSRYIAKLQAAQAPQLSLSRQAVSFDAAMDAGVRTDEDIEDSESIGTDDVR